MSVFIITHYISVMPNAYVSICRGAFPNYDRLQFCEALSFQESDGPMAVYALIRRILTVSDLAREFPSTGGFKPTLKAVHHSER